MSKKIVKKNYYLNVILSIICGILISLFSLPVQVTGGFRGTTFYAHTNIITFIDTSINHCTDCYSYGISWINLIIQFIIVFGISFLLLTIIDKKRRK